MKKPPPSIFHEAPADAPPKVVPRDHPCRVCGDPDAGYGFAMPDRFGGAPRPGDPVEWYCAAHRHLGEARRAEARRQR